LKRAALYLRVSTLDQHPESQALELRGFARQRGYEIVQEYVDHGVSGIKVRRPALGCLLKDAHRHKFDAVLVRIGRSPLNVDHAALVRDRLYGMSLTHVAKKYGLSRASVVRFVKEARVRTGPHDNVSHMQAEVSLSDAIALSKEG
jgi:DNA invertase Pin-like site-specific DNA recombinase